MTPEEWKELSDGVKLFAKSYKLPQGIKRFDPKDATHKVCHALRYKKYFKVNGDYVEFWEDNKWVQLIYTGTIEDLLKHMKLIDDEDVYPEYKPVYADLNKYGHMGT